MRAAAAWRAFAFGFSFGGVLNSVGSIWFSFQDQWVRGRAARGTPPRQFGSGGHLDGDVGAVLQHVEDSGTRDGLLNDLGQLLSFGIAVDLNGRADEETVRAKMAELLSEARNRITRE